ncbi:hypothetical protein [Longimicrobium sp.]|jgi:hypothetical protein|uniref:hypothetical protein n=1 Tax=Longimicrobium sp. TaxID=2029185 RepID=UPI002F94F2BF
MLTFSIRLTASLLWIACSLLLGACDGPDISGPDDPVDVRPFVTGAAAEALTADGLFALAPPAPPSTRPIISPERARLLASAYVASFGDALKPYWEKDRGGAIDLTGLRADPRVFYASTPYEPFPDGYHSAYGRGFGPYYLVRMMSGRSAVLLVAVAAYATEVEIDAEGKVHRPVQRGNEFVSHGVSANATSPNLASLPAPEEAVAGVGRLTGALVSEVPELVRVGLPLGPFQSLWKITLDRSVRVRANSGRTVEVRHLYVGSEPARRLMIPSSEQPTEFAAPAIRVSPAGEELGIEPVYVRIRSGQPTLFEEVVPA